MNHSWCKGRHQKDKHEVIWRCQAVRGVKKNHPVVLNDCAKDCCVLVRVIKSKASKLPLESAGLIIPLKNIKIEEQNKLILDISI